MDPLSVTASVVGILAAAGQVASILSTVRSSLKDAPSSIDRLLSQINELRISLASIRRLIWEIDLAPRHRLSMIQVDQLLATLSEAVLTFSELEALVTPLAGRSKDVSLRDRVRFTLKEDAIGSIMLRLDRHKSSLSLMLSIVQCESDLEAGRSLGLLQDLVQKLLESNLDISRRLGSLEAYDSGSILTNCFRNGGRVNAPEEGSSISDLQSDQSLPMGPPQLSTTDIYVSYEIDLETSRVYRRTQHYESDASFTTSAIRTHAWSVFTGLSLSQVSVISAIALPVFSEELFNGYRYKDPAPNMSVSSYRERKIPSADIKFPLSISFGPAVRIAAPPGLTSNPSVSTAPLGSSAISPPSQSKPDTRIPLHKLVLLGDGGVGKSALAVQFILNYCIRWWDPTIEDSYRKQVSIDGQSCMIEVLDTGGGEQYAILERNWIQEGQAFLLVYSVTRRTSFNLILEFQKRVSSIKECETQGSWYHNYTNNFSCDRGYKNVTKGPLFPILLIGNKSDQITEREVSTEDGQAMADALGCGFIETSAWDNDNVENAFYEAVRQIRNCQINRAKEISGHIQNGDIVSYKYKVID